MIAEGVATVEHGTMLQQLGCKLAQGFGIAYPMPAPTSLLGPAPGGPIQSGPTCPPSGAKISRSPVPVAEDAATRLAERKIVGGDGGWTRYTVVSFSTAASMPLPHATVPDRDSAWHAHGACKEERR